jgi:hypothetical protein
MSHGLGRDGWPSSDSVIRGRDSEIERLRAINADLVDALDMLEMESSNALGVGDGRPLPFGLLDRPLGRAIAKARETLAASKKGQPTTD